jgi:hypothetical protein
MPDSSIDIAATRLNRGQLLLEQQRTRLARLRQARGDTYECERLLRLMEAVVSGFEARLTRLQGENEKRLSAARPGFKA